MLRLTRRELETDPEGTAPVLDPTDERGWETESRQVGLRRRIERDANSHRKPKTTAPIFDSTSRKVNTNSRDSSN